VIREVTIAPSTPQSGGWYALKISDEVRVASQPKMKFAQLCRPEGRYGPHEGRVLQFNKLGDLQGQGQQMAEFGDVPEGDWSYTFGTVTWNEHSFGNRIHQWADMSSELSVTDASVISLTNHGRRYIDRLAAQPFITADVIYTPTGTVSAKSFALSTTGTPAATASREFSYYDHQNIMDLMKGTYNIPGFMGDDYVCVATTRFLRGLRTDTELVSIRKYDDPKLILSGEVGNLEGCRFLHENHVQNNSVGTNGVLGEAVYIGADPVIMLETFPFEIQAATPDMWGRIRALRWVWWGGFARVWSWATDAATRIIRVASL
jgi:N4-gp56 family major capsid protein